MAQFFNPRSFRHILKCINISRYSRRTLLSEAFWCNEAWEQHCQHKLLNLAAANISLDQYSATLEKGFQNTLTKNKPSGVDIDIYACNVKEKYQLKDLENLIKKFRSTRRCIEQLPSTWHAFIRLYLKNGLHDSLQKVLMDPLTYGIFPQHHDFCLLYDYFLNNKDYRGAAKIAHVQMLQEDFDHPLSAHFAMYACAQYLANPTEWADPKRSDETEPEEQGDDDEEEEEKYIRVPYLYEPFFDDHFDLTEPKHILGKALNLAGLATDSAVGRACQLWGIALYEKWEEASTLDLDRILASGKPVLSEGVAKFRECLEKIEDEEVKNLWAAKLEAQLSKLNILEGKIISSLESELQALVKREPEFIANQKQLYEEWAQTRQAKFDEQVEAYEMQKRKRLIEQRKTELQEKEDLLYFFDNWDKRHMELKEVMEEAEKRDSEKGPEEEYIPPEVKGWQRKLREKEIQKDHLDTILD